MNEKQLKEMFDKYNPVGDVVRCPSGRTKMREQLDLYAKAAGHLYGIISKDEFVKIFNSQNEEQTTVAEVYTLLLPYVLKHRCYGFYKNYLVHVAVLRDYDWVDYLEREQKDKPRYIPEKDEFLKYSFDYYEDKCHWLKVCMFLWKIFGTNEHTTQGFAEIRNYISHSNEINELGPIMEKHNFVFSGKKQFKKFFDLLVLAKNNSRVWENKGYTPTELFDIRKQEEPSQPIIHNVKVGRNDSCPCGSGKKYKKCCAVIQANRTAQLSSNECKLFYETWYKLLDFVNNRYNITDMYIDLVYPSFHDELELYKLREKLWEEPKLIGAFLKENKTLTVEECSLLQSWQTCSIKDDFVLLGHTSEYSVLMSMQSGKSSKLYGVKGMTSSIAEAMRHPLPAMVKTVLLPFKDKIVYDSFFSIRNVSFGKGVRDMFAEEYDKIKSKSNIITSLTMR
ncbi:MAG: SEC-C metal-binding domain-containing protein [Candidatus Bathyarchaeota archaeon]|nr:SEC-C metal-binding domain-containing protein [Candidatus Termiticorpusculum sp.]